jgi:hypothetical protein
MKAKPSKQKGFYIHRSHSFSGVTHSKPDMTKSNFATIYGVRTKRPTIPTNPTDPTSKAAGSGVADVTVEQPAERDDGGERIGRFQLKRYNSEKR